MKQKLLLLLTALCFGFVSGVKADEPAGSYVYLNPFDSEEGLTKEGDVTIVASGEAAFGNVYKNPGSATPRSSYYVIPSEVLRHSTTSNQMTIAFWVKADAEAASNSYMWAPIFTAFESKEKLNAGNWTHLGIEYRGVMEYNLNGPTNVGENWCDFTNAQQTGHGGGDAILYHGDNDWLKDKQWHHMAIVYDAAADGSQKATIYMDGKVANEWTLDGTSNGQNLRNFFANTSKLDYVCFGGCQIRDYNDNDAPFWYDDLYITNAALSPAQIQKIIFDKDPAAYIAAKKGDLTSIINGDFQVDASGWSGGNLVTVVPTRSWRGTSYANNFYETNYTSNMEYVLNDMPAGTYKVVAAARAWDGTITAKLNGTIGTHYDGIGDLATLGAPEINLNGVQMPYSNLGGFTSDDYGHNWRWIYATATLAEAGTLTITFNAESNSGDWRWMCIDDVYLYCTKLGETNYTKTVRDNTTAFNPANTVATADIIFENPNTVLRTSSNYITTAAGEPMNNDQYGSNKMTKLVLYDGHEFSYNLNNVAADNGAILYRSIPKDTWCTLVVPFVPTTALTKKVPSELSAGTLSFTDAVSANDEPMLIMSDTELTKIEGTRSGASGDMTSGVGAPMVGTYSNIADLSAVTGTNYVVGTDGKLHKVTGAVTVAPFRAYFNIAESEARNVISMNFDGGYTGINAVEATEAEAGALKDGKFLENGKIIIVKNGVKYGANGQKLN
jgi:hypothetical protein